MCSICSATSTFNPLLHPVNQNTITEILDAAADISTAYRMSVGDIFNGRVAQSGDADWIGVTLVAGERYTINLDAGTTGTAITDTYLRIFGSTGSLLSSNDDANGYYSELTFTASTSGTYYISAAGYGSNIGTYKLSITEAAASPAPATLNTLAEYLTDGFWEDFGDVPRSFDTSNNNDIYVNLSGLTAAAQQLALWAFEAWEMVADLEFIVTTATSYLANPNSGYITFDDADSGAYAYSEFNATDGSLDYSVVNISTAWITSYGTEIDSYSFQTYVHEIGHALGLGHLGNYNGSAGYTPGSNFTNDSWQVSVMSYFSQTENYDVNADFALLAGPMMADILAIQNLYGAADTSSVTVGNTTWGANTTLGGYIGRLFSIFAGTSSDTSFYSGSDVAFTIYDVSGTDTLDLSFTTLANRIDMRAEQFSTVNGLVGSLGIARGTVIEHLVAGSAADYVLGNSAANRINGGSGSDTLDGGAGNDTLTGGVGVDTASYASAGAGVTVNLANSASQNTVGAGIDVLATIENLSGSAYNDILMGNGEANRIDGGAGNDVINGRSGLDTLNGGQGSDIYLLTLLTEKTAAEIADSGTTGTDELRFAATVAGTLMLVSGDTGLERVVIGTGTAASAITTATTALNVNATAAANALSILGNAGMNALTGSAFADTIDGGAGNDILIGGAGNDALIGGLGDDRLTGGAGIDTASYSSASAGVTVSLALLSAQNTGGAGRDVLAEIENLNGSGFNDILTGSAGANRIDGGAGNDVMSGGAGNDNLIGGAGNDRLTGGDGVDTLSGGLGSDVFVFNTSPNATTNLDTISDFVSAADDIWLARSAMAGFSATGRLSADDFRFGAGTTDAGDASDRIIYNTTTGALYYDADGSGAGAAVQIAVLTGAASLSYSDIFII